MAITATRWPTDLLPSTCTFTRSRNDVHLLAPRSRQRTTVQLGRPLWKADLSWRMLDHTKLAKLRYYLEGLEGAAGSVLIWDFAAKTPAPVIGPTPSFWNAGTVPIGALAVGATQWASSPAYWGLGAGEALARQGQYVQIGRQLVVVSEDCIVAGDGSGILKWLPALPVAIGAGNVMRFFQAAAEMELISTDFSAAASAGEGFVTVSASFMETPTPK